MVDTGDLSDPFAITDFQGLDNLSWNSTESVPWLTITPTSGSMATQPVVTISKSALSPGWQTAIINFTTTGNVYSDQMTVDAYLGSVFRTYLPLVR
jgi:hypothetical protein